MVMIYNGKEAAEKIRDDLANRAAALDLEPTLAIVSVGSNPSTLSFIKIKRNYAMKVGVVIKEFNFPEEDSEAGFVSKLLAIVENHIYDGIIVQLPLPSSYDTKRVLDMIPRQKDVDVLGSEAVDSFEKTSAPVPPVAKAIAHILSDTHMELEKKNVLLIGRGRLVGMPVTTWFAHQGITPHIIDITTEEETKLRLCKDADIVISGAGTPHFLKPEHFKEGVVLIDAGTSEQGGTLAGDCDPACADIASIFTPVPGGVGPLTVACLFENVIKASEERHNKK